MPPRAPPGHAVGPASRDGSLNADIQTINMPFTRPEQHIDVLCCADIKNIGKLEHSCTRNEVNLVFTHHVPMFQLTCVIFSYVSRSDEDLGMCALVGRRHETVL